MNDFFFGDTVPLNEMTNRRKVSNIAKCWKYGNSLRELVLENSTGVSNLEIIYVENIEELPDTLLLDNKLWVKVPLVKMRIVVEDSTYKIEFQLEHQTLSKIEFEGDRHRRYTDTSSIRFKVLDGQLLRIKRTTNKERAVAYLAEESDMLNNLIGERELAGEYPVVQENEAPILEPLIADDCSGGTLSTNILDNIKGMVEYKEELDL